jgi:hypothetical protein
MRSPSLDTIYTVTDLVEFKRGFHHRWRAGWVTGVSAHSITVKAWGASRAVVIEPGKRGKVRKPSGERLDQLLDMIQASVRARKARQERRRAERAGARPPAPAPVVARLDGQPRPVPRPRKPYRDSVYLDFVRRWACIGCGAPPPSEAHHHGPRAIRQKTDDYRAVPLCRPCHQAVTDTRCLPGRSEAQTQEIILRAQVDHLVEWEGRQGYAMETETEADRRFLDALAGEQRRADEDEGEVAYA